MRAAVRLLSVAVAMELIAMPVAYWVVRELAMSDPTGATLVASFPFFGVAVLALILAIKQRMRPDAHAVNRRIADLLRLLVFSGSGCSSSGGSSRGDRASI
jgi:hypothetical protein